jgi:hypothetical protein
MMLSLEPGIRLKIYLILAFLSLVLLSFSILQVAPIIVEREASLGLASYLPPCYWIGLALILVTSIFAFLDSQIKKDAVFILLLIILGLFLFGVTVFFEENATQPETYYPFGEVRTLLTSHHINIVEPTGGHTGSYHSWPAFHFINAAILETTGITSDSYPVFIRYMTLYFLLCFILITYAIGKRFKLSPENCFLLSFLALSSWLIGFAGYYYPRLYGMMLYLVLFMLLLTPEKTIAETVAVILLFTTSVLTHGMLPLAFIPAVILLAIYRRDPRFVALFIVITFAWYIYQAPIAMEIGVGQLLNPLWEILRLTQLERYQESAPALLWAMRYSRLIYLAAYAGLMAGCVFLLLRRRIIAERRKQVISLFAFAIGLASTVVLGFGETTYRTYLYCIVPALCIVGLSLPRRKIAAVLMVVLMCIFVIAYLPANHSNEAIYGQVLTTELKGTEFFATKVNPPIGIAFYTFAAQLVVFHNPALLAMVGIPNCGDIERDFPILHEQFPDIYVRPISVLDRLHYVITSSQGAFDYPGVPWQTWPQTEAGKMANLIYDNGHFQIYDNYMWH